MQQGFRADLDDLFVALFGGEPQGSEGRDKMFHIKITQWVDTEEWTEREHTVISEEPDENGKIVKEYGYPRQVKTKGKKEIAVLEQTVEEIDLPKVIAAINGMDLKTKRS